MTSEWSMSFVRHEHFNSCYDCNSRVLSHYEYRKKDVKIGYINCIKQPRIENYSRNFELDNEEIIQIHPLYVPWWSSDFTPGIKIKLKKFSGEI